jgi:Pyruvate/2-oxoacid:ferredoxin oxidoreductase delta subunit
MATIKRKVIRIDEDKCNGCGLCISACPEGALQIVNGKAKLVKDNFCDGLGACLGECPQQAMVIEERDADEYDANGVVAYLAKQSPELVKKHDEHLQAHAAELSASLTQPMSSGCPSSRMVQWEKNNSKVQVAGNLPSELRQWPVQLHLVSPEAPYFKNAELVLVADCVPIAYANFHHDFLIDKAIAIACPKLDTVEPYVDKISQIIVQGNIKSIKVVHMEVPCCFGLIRLAKEAIERSQKEVLFETVNISIKGEIKK